MKNSPISLEDIALRENAVFGPICDFGMVAFAGPDARDFLHRMLTSAVKSLKTGEIQPSLLLDARGKILAKMSLFAGDEKIFAIVEGHVGVRLAQTLEGFRFAERMSIENLSDDFLGYAIRGPKADAMAASLAPLAGTFFSLRQEQERGWDFFFPQSQETLFFERMNEVSGSRPFPKIDEEFLQRHRVAHGVARYGKEIDEGFYPQEARWDSFCAPDKGCYIGQETVARMKTYGKPPRLLVALAFPSAPLPKPGDPLLLGTEIVGSVRATASYEKGVPGIGLGLVKTEIATPGKFLDYTDHKQTARRAIVLEFPLDLTTIPRYLAGAS